MGRRLRRRARKRCGSPCPPLWRSLTGVWRRAGERRSSAAGVPVMILHGTADEAFRPPRQGASVEGVAKAPGLWALAAWTANPRRPFAQHHAVHPARRGGDTRSQAEAALYAHTRRRELSESERPTSAPKS